MNKKFAFLFVGVLLGVSLVVGAMTNFTFYTGGTTLSLDDAKFRSSSNWWSGDTWILTLVQGGMGQNWYGLIDADDIGRDSGETPARDFEMKIEMVEQACRYELYKDSTMKNIYAWYYVEWDNLNPLYFCNDNADVKAHCSNGEVEVSGRLYNDAVFHPCFCIGKVQYTNALGGLKPAVVHSDVKVGINVGSGYEYKETTLPSGAKQLDFRNVGIDAVGVWDGYTVEQVCDTFIQREKDKYYIFYDSKYGGGWSIGLTENYDDYKNVVSNFDSWMLSGSYDPNVISGHVSSLNSASSTSRVQYNPSTGYIVNRADNSAATAYYKNVLQSPIQNPLWTFYIKAEELGVVQPIPEARIDYVTSEEFGSGERGKIEAKVINVGEAGNIEVWASCNFPFSTSYSHTRYISASGYSIFIIEVDANVGAKTSGSCTVCAKGMGEIGEDCKDVAVTVNPQKICTPGSMICEDDVIRKCNVEGSGWADLTDCEDDGLVCKYNNQGNPECVEEDDEPSPEPSPDECAWWDIMCHINNFLAGVSGFLQMLFWIGIAVAAIIVAVFIGIIAYVVVRK